MDSKIKWTCGGLEEAIVTAPVRMKVDSKLLIPVGKNFRVVRGIDGDRANVLNSWRQWGRQPGSAEKKGSKNDLNHDVSPKIVHEQK